MKLERITGVAALTAAFALTACGGGPDIDKVREDFNNPSGSTKDQKGVMAANGKRDASESALRLTTGIPGAGLTATGKVYGIEKIGPRYMFERDIRRVWAHAQSKNLQALSAAQFDDEPTSGDCNNSPEAQAAMEKLYADLIKDAVSPFGGGGSASASTDFTVDLATCSNGELSGTLEVVMEVEFDSDSMRFAIEEKFIDVCEAQGQQACINGNLIMEATGMGLSGGEGGTLEFLTAWELDATWTEDGKALSAKTKGGIRLAADDNMFGMEYLIYVIDSSGEEVSYVMRFAANADGSWTLEYEGADGKLSCTANADGSATCTGTDESGAAFDLSWTDAEYDDVLDDEDFADY